MKKKILLLTDYKGRFGSKHFDQPYRSGMDKSLLTKWFAEHDFQVEFKNFANIDFKKGDYKGKVILYTSSEDQGYYYKDYIEDIIHGLELAGAEPIPPYKYLQANNNKVFMEILRDLTQTKYFKNIRSYPFGTFEDLISKIDQIKFPCVFKTSMGATGSGVFLVKDRGELIKKVKKLSRTKDNYYELWDYGRSKKHKGYMRDSKYRKKFILQEFIPNLKNDWKIYIFGEKLFIFFRPILKGRGIKASGGGYDNYRYGKEALAPDGILNFAYSIYKHLDIPHVSLDIAYDGQDLYLIEFQALYFGTAGIVYSDHYFTQGKNNSWVAKKNPKNIEKTYVESIVHYLDQSSPMP